MFEALPARAALGSVPGGCWGPTLLKRRLHEAKRIYLIRRKALHASVQWPRPEPSRRGAFNSGKAAAHGEQIAPSCPSNSKYRSTGGPIEKLYRALGAWTELMVGLRNMTRVLKRLGKHHLAKAFDAWSGQHFTMARKRDAANRIRRIERRCVLRLQARQASRALPDLGFLCTSLPPSRKVAARQSDPVKTIRGGSVASRGAAVNKWRDGLVFLKHVERLVLRFVKRHLYIAPDVERTFTDHRPATSRSS